MNNKMSFFVALLPLAAACSASLPPPELIDARAAYNKASKGPAATLNPAQLHVAEEQLALAERTFDKDGDTFKTRDEAYVAQRKSELAEAQARITEAVAETNMSAKQVQLTQARGFQSARVQLSQTREQLAAATAAMAELAALKTVQNVKHEERGTVITLSGSVLFASGKYELLPSAQETLMNVATALTKSDPSSKILVQGFTDSQGPLAFNEVLSQHRAEAVLSFLTSHGVAADRATAKGLGPASAVATNDTAEGRANNRRVEIVVSPPPRWRSKRCRARRRPPRPQRSSNPTTREGDRTMNWDQVEGQWKQLGSQIKSKWAKLTDDDLKNLSAKKDDLIGKIQERYGVLKDEAEHQVDQWLHDLKPSRDTVPNATRNDRPAAGKQH